MKKLLPLVLLLVLSSLAFAAPVPVTIDFEQLASYTQITNQYAAQNALFTNALQLNVPDYNYFDYPPHSGIGVATNDPNDPMVVYFTANVDVNSINFWYAAPDGIIATAYDAFGNALDSVNGPGIDGSNLWLPFSGSGLARWVTISAVDGPDSVTVDDFQYTPMPEPGTLTLLASGVAGLAGIMRRRFIR